MSRKIILSLATAATVAVAALSSQSADARGFGGGGFGGGRGFGGGGFAMRGIGGGGRIGGFPGRGGGRLIPILNPGRGHGGPIHPIFPRHPHPGHGWVFHGHGHWVFRGGRWIIDDVAVEETPVLPLATPTVAPGPCTCLTKTYTHSGLVVFADVCTKESASASVNATVGDASQVPTTPVAASAVPMSVVPTAPNYAGRTYEDYLAANPQAANPAPDSMQRTEANK